MSFIPIARLIVFCHNEYVSKILSIGFGIVGLILLLAGIGLITLTQSLLLYTGLVLLVLAAAYFLRG